MKMIAVNKKMGMSFEFGLEALTRVEYISAKDAPVKNIIDLPDDKSLREDELIMVIYSLNHKREEVPHVYIRPQEWVLTFGD